MGSTLLAAPPGQGTVDVELAVANQSSSGGASSVEVSLVEFENASEVEDGVAVLVRSRDDDASQQQVELTGETGERKHGNTHDRFNRASAIDPIFVKQWTIRGLAPFFGGCLLGFCCAVLAYGVFSMHDPMRSRNWWRCSLLCGSMWMALFIGMLATRLHALVLSPMCEPFPFLGCSILLASGFSITMAVWGLLTSMSTSLQADLFKYPLYFQGAITAVTTAVSVELLSRRLLVPVHLRNRADVRYNIRWAGRSNALFIPITVLQWGVAVAYQMAALHGPFWLPVVVLPLFTIAFLLNVALSGVMLDRDVPLTNQATRDGLTYITSNTTHMSSLSTVLGSSPLPVAIIVALFDVTIQVAYIPFLLHQTDETPVERIVSFLMQRITALVSPFVNTMYSKRPPTTHNAAD